MEVKVEPLGEPVSSYHLKDCSAEPHYSYIMAALSLLTHQLAGLAHGLHILHHDKGNSWLVPDFRCLLFHGLAAWQSRLPSAHYCYYKAHCTMHLKTQAVKERNAAAGL